MTIYPPWQVHSAEGYDEAMQLAAAEVFRNLQNNADYRRAILADPRDLHASLFRDFAPDSHPEYAGTYRGTVATSLEKREISAPTLFKPDGHFAFEAPEGLPDKVDFLLRQITQEIQEAHHAPTYTQLLMLTHLFCWWGKLHPFLDGNGHIQRILFAAAAIELGIPLSPRFAIHPRSYDRLLALPLEMYTRAAENQRQQFIAMVAEYLSTWLAGPFDRPGSGIPDE